MCLVGWTFGILMGWILVMKEIEEIRDGWFGFGWVVGPVVLWILILFCSNNGISAGPDFCISHTSDPSHLGSKIFSLSSNT